MTHSFNLEPLLNLMKEKNEETTRMLGKLIAAEQNEKNRLLLLENYRKEYADHFLKTSQEGITPTLLKNYQDFLARIDEAIASQKKLLQKSQENKENGKKIWQEQHTKMKAVDALKTRFNQKITLLENKREQKLLDEFANRKSQHFPRST